MREFVSLKLYYFPNICTYTMSATPQSPSNRDLQVYYRNGRHRSQSSSSSGPIVVQPAPYRNGDMQYQTPIILQRPRSSSYTRMAPVTMVIQEPSRTASPPRGPQIVPLSTDVTVRELESVINDFSSTIVVVSNPGGTLYVPTHRTCNSKTKHTRQHF